jgi:hypothetical protein
MMTRGGRPGLYASILTIPFLTLLSACGGDDAATTGAPGAAGQGATAGAAGNAAQAGNGSGGGGSSAGQSTGGAGAGGAGAAGVAGSAGGAGVSGQSGAAGQSGTAGQSGQAGAGGDGTSGAAGAAGTGGASGTGGAAGTGGASGAGQAGSGGSAPGCADTCKVGTCVGEICCAVDSVCGASCCAAGDVCSFDQCITPGNVCRDASECAANELCDLSVGNSSGDGAGGNGGASGAGGGEPLTCTGATITEGRCLPRPPTCADDAPPIPGGPITCVEACQFKPPSIPIQPSLLYAWGGETVAPFSTDIMATPIVAQLDDDDCDGKVTERDIPEIVFTSFHDGKYGESGTLHVVSVQEGALKEKWSVAGAHPSKTAASGNIDGVAGNEVVVCGIDRIVRAYAGATGDLLWASTSPLECLQPALADLDQDGAPEVIVEGGILNGADGTLKAAFSPPMLGTFAVSDLDRDGKLDVVSVNRSYHADGVAFADTGDTGFSYSTSQFFFESGPAVGDLDNDGVPEVVAAYFRSHTLAIWQYDPTAPTKARFVRKGLDLNGTIPPGHCGVGSNGYLRGGGPVTVGDFNKDGYPDVALAGGVGYAVFDGKKLMQPIDFPTDYFLWTRETQDCSSAGTGSSLFDFDGDGRAEVTYADELTLHVYDGETGTPLFETCNTNGTLNEYPVIADVDNDGHADLLVVSNAYSNFNCGGVKTSGLRIFGDPQKRWVRTRSVWNQHAYAITNIGGDGTIPKKELANWSQKSLNNFRQNKQPGQEFAAPDAVITLLYPKCQGEYGLSARVTNVGEAPLPAGVVVGFYLGAPGTGPLLGTTTTTQALYPAQSQVVTLALPTPPDALAGGTTPFHVRVDDTTEPHPAWTECRTDNNTSKAFLGACGKD